MRLKRIGGLPEMEAVDSYLQHYLDEESEVRSLRVQAGRPAEFFVWGEWAGHGPALSLDVLRGWVQQLGRGKFSWGGRDWVLTSTPDPPTLEFRLLPVPKPVDYTVADFLRVIQKYQASPLRLRAGEIPDTMLRNEWIAVGQEPLSEGEVWHMLSEVCEAHLLLEGRTVELVVDDIPCRVYRQEHGIFVCEPVSS